MLHQDGNCGNSDGFNWFKLVLTSSRKLDNQRQCKLPSCVRVAMSLKAPNELSAKVGYPTAGGLPTTQPPPCQCGAWRLHGIVCLQSKETTQCSLQSFHRSFVDCWSTYKEIQINTTEKLQPLSWLHQHRTSESVSHFLASPKCGYMWLLFFSCLFHLIVYNCVIFSVWLFTIAWSQ